MRALSLIDVIKKLLKLQALMCLIFLILVCIYPQKWAMFGGSLLVLLSTLITFRILKRGAFLNAKGFFAVMIFLEVLKIILFALGTIFLLKLNAKPSDFILGFSSTYLIYFLLLF